MNNFTSHHSLSSILNESSREEGEQQLRQPLISNSEQDYTSVKEELDKLSFSPRKQSIERILQYSAQKKGQKESRD